MSPSAGHDVDCAQAEDEYRRFLACAEVLRTLAAAEPLTFHGSAHPMRLVLRTGAEACEQFGEAVRQRAHARQRVAALESLLAQVAEVLSAEPLPIHGGAWTMFELAQAVERALGKGRNGS